MWGLEERGGGGGGVCAGGGGGGFVQTDTFNFNTRNNRRLCSVFDLLAIEERATCNLSCVKNCCFPHTDVSTEYLRSSSVSNVIKTVTAQQQTSQSDCCARSNQAKDMQIAGISILLLPALGSRPESLLL